MGDRAWGASRTLLGQRTLTVAVIVAASGALGVLSVRSTTIALLAAAGVLAAGLTMVNPVVIVVAAVPASLLMARVGGILSVADVVLAGATVLAIGLLRRRYIPELRPLMWAGTAYLTGALPTVILNPYSQNTIEWVHELVLVIGSILVGYAVGRAGRAHIAAGLYVVACMGIGVASVIAGLVMLAGHEHTFGPVFLPALNKNFIGDMLCIAIVLLYARPRWFRWSLPWSWTAIIVCAAGIAASGSRQAMIGGVAGLIVVSLRPRSATGRRPKIIWLAAIPIVIAVVVLVVGQLDSGNKFNSANQRLTWYATTIQIWRTSPVFGVGLRWWYTGRFSGGGFQPPNAELEVLSSVGIVGLIGFIVMFLVGFWALWRIDPAFGTVGAAVIATRFVQAQFDLYWVAGQSSILWIVAGLCVGALAYARATTTMPTMPASPVPRRLRPRGRARPAR